MMLVITKDDFKKLSVACRRELISLLDSSDQSAGEEGHADYDEDALADMSPPRAGGANIDEVLDREHVVDLTVEEARELVANISPKSQQTLRLFALGFPVDLDDLIGEGRIYRDVTELKRSLVGAVKRRLRTISGDRLATLLLSVPGEGKRRIGIRPLAAASLRQVLGVPEPMPNFEFFDQESGKCLPKDSDGARKLQDQLQAAWQKFSGRPEVGFPSVGYIEFLQHFVAHGFKTLLGEPIDYAIDGERALKTEFVFSSGGKDSVQLLVEIRREGLAEFQANNAGGEASVCLSHDEVPGVVAMPG